MGGDLIIDEEDYGLDAGQAYFSSSNLPLIGTETQTETKKVPPLRILLPKTPNKKEDTQRLTRSRVKQTGATLNEVPRWGQKRGRAGKTSVDNADQTEQDGVKLEQEEDEVEGEAEGPEDEYSRSDAGEESRSAFERKSKEPEEGSAANEKQSTKSASATLLLFSKNSFDQTVEFSRMIQEKWAKGFVDELKRDVVKPSHLADLDRVEFVHRQTQAEQKLPLIVNIQESWPESLQKLAIEQARRREQMEIAHKAERERLFQFGKRELVRLMQKTAAYSHSNINVVRLLRDAELYNPSTFDSAMDEPPEIQLASRAQLLQRLKHMAATTKNRHTMEAHSLVVCQQAEWTRCPAVSPTKTVYLILRGVLLGRYKTISDKSSTEDAVQQISIVDAIPGFHNSLVTPRLEILLIHLDAYCQEEKLKIVGFYFANQQATDNGFDEVLGRMALDKLNDPIFSSVNSNCSAVHAFVHDGKWKSKSCVVENEEDTITATSIAIQNKLYRDLADFENYLEHPTIADFYNTELNIKIETIL
uniref:MPN domain-containing protein n=1 Tax=Ditylenchus dipsaci TaxID=166011 RepID=A0A915CSE6_9BILA